jgi:hypothetical protein
LNGYVIELSSYSTWLASIGWGRGGWGRPDPWSACCRFPRENAACRSTAGGRATGTTAGRPLRLAPVPAGRARSFRGDRADVSRRPKGHTQEPVPGVDRRGSARG